MSHPIPDSALDDRLAFVGTSGSGKTYSAGTGVERLLDHDARCIIIDPLDVWYGMRALEDGKTPSRYPVVILGGQHGDLPINEHSGALIGETVATSAESFIVSLGSIGSKAAERRFMLAFLVALYKHANGEPVHLVFDEADMWAPQKLLDKEGEAAKLLGQMETIVRRGRVKGFIPWLITQRPAVLSKDVLSQADGLIAFKLTSSQDRDAIGAWIEGQADRQQGREILGALPAMDRGRGVVWIPSRSILQTSAFPRKRTFDSSATPKRGETKRSAILRPLNVEALKGRLAVVAQEAEANNPTRLKAEIARLKAEAAKRPAASDVDAQSHREALTASRQEGYQDGFVAGLQHAQAGLLRVPDHLRAIRDAAGEIERRLQAVGDGKAGTAPAPRRSATSAASQTNPNRDAPARRAPAMSAITHGVNPVSADGNARRRVMIALAQNPDGLAGRKLAILADVKLGGSTWRAVMAALRKERHVDETGDHIQLNAAGLRELGDYDPLPTGDALRMHFRGQMGNATRLAIFDVICSAYPRAIDATAAAEQAGVEPGGSTWRAHMAYLRGLELVSGSREIRAAEELFS